MAKTIFIDGDRSQGITGTRVTAEFLNAINNHRHTGLDVDGHGALDFAVASGSDNAYGLTLSPALAALITGMPIFFKANHTNTGAATLNVSGLGAVDLRNSYNQALVAGDIRSGQIIVVVYDGAYFQVINNPKPQFRGCLLYMSTGSQNLSGGANRLYFDSERYDTDSFHDTANTSRITVPAGVSRMRFKYHIGLVNDNGGAASVALHKNGDITTFIALTPIEGGGIASYETPSIEVTPGDYYELWARLESSGDTGTAEAGVVLTAGFSAEVVG